MQNITNINGNEAENRHFYNLVNNQHADIKLKHAQARADRLQNVNAMASRIFTAMLFVGALLLLAL